MPLDAHGCRGRGPEGTEYRSRRLTGEQTALSRVVDRPEATTPDRGTEAGLWTMAIDQNLHNSSTAANSSIASCKSSTI